MKRRLGGGGGYWVSQRMGHLGTFVPGDSGRWVVCVYSNESMVEFNLMFASSWIDLMMNKCMLLGVYGPGSRNECENLCAAIAVLLTRIVHHFSVTVFLQSAPTT